MDFVPPSIAHSARKSVSSPSYQNRIVYGLGMADLPDPANFAIFSRQKIPKDVGVKANLARRHASKVVHPEQLRLRRLTVTVHLKG